MNIYQHYIKRKISVYFFQTFDLQERFFFGYLLYMPAISKVGKKYFWLNLCSCYILWRSYSTKITSRQVCSALSSSSTSSSSSFSFPLRPSRGMRLTMGSVVASKLFTRGDWVGYTQSTPLLPPSVTGQKCNMGHWACFHWRGQQHELLSLLFIAGACLDSLPQVINIWPNSDSLRGESLST